MQHTYESDVKTLIQFAKDQGWDEVDVMNAVNRLESAIENSLTDYSIPYSEE